MCCISLWFSLQIRRVCHITTYPYLLPIRCPFPLCIDCIPCLLSYNEFGCLFDRFSESAKMCAHDTLAAHRLCSLGLVALTDIISSPHNRTINSHFYFCNNYMQLDITVLECGKLQPLFLSWYLITYCMSVSIIKKGKILFLSAVWESFEVSGGFLTWWWAVGSDLVFFASSRCWYRTRRLTWAMWPRSVAL